MAATSTVVIPGSSLCKQAWWPQLHRTIIIAFQQKDIQAFPPSWTRLNLDEALGAAELAKELGTYGEMAIMFSDDEPVACGGISPHSAAYLSLNNPDWLSVVNKKLIEHQAASGENPEDADVLPQVQFVCEDWNVLCFCVHPDHRGKNLSRQLLQTLADVAKAKGGRSLLSNFCIEETGSFWPKMGFNARVGNGGVLEKGYIRKGAVEELQTDLHFMRMSKDLYQK